MMRGHPPTPIERKRALGNPGKRPLPAVATGRTGLAELPDPPDHLDPPGLGLWGHVWSNASWLHPQVDFPLVTMLCEWEDQRSQFMTILRDEGLMTTGSTGQKTVHPAFNALKVLEKQMWASMASMGIPPVDRARMGVELVKGQTKLEELIAKRRTAQN